LAILILKQNIKRQNDDEIFPILKIYKIKTLIGKWGKLDEYKTHNAQVLVITQCRVPRGNIRNKEDIPYLLTCDLSLLRE